MSFEIREIKITGTDNIHTLMGKIYIPEGEIKGVVHVVHGMNEYIDRYTPFMSTLAKNGYVAFGYDHLGHGNTAANPQELGFIAHHDGWKYLVNDVCAFTSAVKEMYPDLPFVLFGHSMGSFIVRLAAVKSPELYSKLIICGTGGKNPLSAVGLTMTKVIAKIKGEKYVSNFILNTAFGSYNRRFDGDPHFSWLTVDPTNIEKYKADPLCAFKFTVSAMHDLVMLNTVCNKGEWFREINKQMPILLISGDCDPVGDYGKGVSKVYRALKRQGADVKKKFYKGYRHEILNDYCKNDVTEDILNFIM